MSIVRHAALFAHGVEPWEWWDESTNTWVSTETFNTGSTTENAFAPHEWTHTSENPSYQWQVATSDGGCEGPYSASWIVHVVVFEWWDESSNTWVTSEVFNTGSTTENPFSAGEWTTTPPQTYEWAVATSDGGCESDYSAENTVTLIGHPRPQVLVTKWAQRRSSSY